MTGFTQLLKKFITCVKLSNVKKYVGGASANTRKMIRIKLLLLLFMFFETRLRACFISRKGVAV